MSTSIEQRVVQMRFDNKQFESGVAQSMSTLDKLKAKLNFKGAVQGLDEVSKAADKVSLNSMIDQTDKVGIKFDALAVVAVTALQRITNAAMSAGAQIAKSLTITPVTQGFQEYELKMGSVQTIMNSTGESLETVNKYLEELNTYSDRTIYSFKDMTSNIGKFTNAGVKLEDAVKAIQGISNEAALSGANANEASRAMYNFSQALASGAVRLIDWKSIENANMATVEFKEELIKTAAEIGTLIEKDGQYISTTTDLTGHISDAFNATRGFNDSLSAQWLTTDVLTKTLARYSDETTDLGKRAFAAATEIKTFSMMMDTLQESVGSGWAQTWEIVFGDFEEAKKLWTSIGNVVGNFIDAESDARNELLKGWKDLGGRTAVIDTIASAFNNLIDVVSALRSGFEDIFPPITAQQLYDATQSVKRFIDSIKLSDEAINTLRVTFKALLLPIKAVTTAFEIGVFWAGKAVQAIFKLVDSIIALPSKIGTLGDPFRKLFGDERYNKIAQSLSKIVSGLADAFGVAGKSASELLRSFTRLAATSIGKTFGNLVNSLKPLAGWILDRVVDGIEAIANADYSKILGWAHSGVDGLRIGFSKLLELLQNGVSLVKDFFSQFNIKSPSDILKGMVGAINVFRQGMWEFIKSLGGDKVLKAIGDAGSRLAGIIINLANAIRDVISVLTPGKILVFGFGTALVWTVTQVGNAFKALSGIGESVSGMFKSVGGVFDALKERIQPNKMSQASTAIIGFAAALTILAGAMFIVSKIDADRLWVSFGAMSALIGVFSVFSGLMIGLSVGLLKTPEIAKNLQTLSLALVAMSASVAILAAALYAISKIDVEGIGAKLLIMGGAIATLVGGSIIVGKYAKDLGNSAIFMVAFAGSMLLIVKALKALGEVDLSDSVGNVTIVLAVMSALAIISRLMTKTTKTIRKSDSSKSSSKSSMQGLTGLILDLLLVMAALKILAKADTANLITGLLNMIPVFGVLIALAAIMKYAGSETAKIGTQVLAISGAMIILSFAIEKIGAIDKGIIDRAMTVIVSIMGLFALLTLASKLEEGSSTVKMGSTFLGMASAILILGLAIDYIGNLSLEAAVQGTAVVSAVLAMFGVLMLASSVVSSSKGTIAAMTVAIGLLVASLAILTLLDFKELMGSAVALGTVLLAFGASIKLISGLKMGSAIGSMLVLLSAVSILGLTFAHLSEIDPNSVLAQATGISEVLLALGVSMSLLRRQRGQNDVALSTVGTMGLILTELVVVTGILSGMPAGENMIAKATAMSEIVLALSTAMVILGKSNLSGDWSQIGKTLTVMAAVVSGATLVIEILNAMPLNEGLVEKAGSLSILMLAMSGAIAIISKLGAGLAMLGSVAPAAIGGALAAEGIVLTIIAFIELIGWAFDKFESLESSLTMAESIFPRIGTVIGEFVGNILGGLIGGTVGTALETFGTSLSNFADNVQGFLSLDVKQETVDSIGRLAQVATAITGATFLDAIARFGQGSSSMEVFGSQLAAFGPYFAEFAYSIANIPQDAVTVSAACLEALADVLATVPTDGGLMGMIFGKKDLTGFGAGLSAIATGMASYATALSGANITPDTIETTNQVAEMLVTLANKVPKTGGLVSFLGAHDIGKFGEQITAFAEGLKTFMNSLNGVYIDKGKLSVVNEYGTMLVNLANKVPKTGALVTFLGGHDIGAFGEQLSLFADGLVGFLTKINLVKIDQDQVNAARAAGETMVALADTVPKTGALIEFFGGNDLGVFGEQVGLFGKGLAGFFSSINSVGLDQGKVDLAKTAGIAFVEIADALGTNTGISTLFEGTSLGVFGEQIKRLGEHLADYYYSVSVVSWETVTESVNQLNRILDIVPKMKNISAGDTSAFAQFLRELAMSGVSEFSMAFMDAEDDLRQGVIDGINNAFKSAKANLNSYSESYTVLVDALVAGVDAHVERLVIKARDICDRFTQTVNDQWQQLENAGSFIITSLIIGIEQSEDKLTTTITTMMTDVIKTMNTSLGIRGSYSEKFQNAGKMCVEGFANGVRSTQGSAYGVIKQLGLNIMNTFYKAMDMHSPPAWSIGAGEMTPEGYGSGVLSKIGEATGVIKELANGVIQTAQNELGIENGISLKGVDIGESLNVGIGDGMLDSDYAHEAAGTVADGILDVFKQRFSDISDTMSILDQEFELWAKRNPVSTYSDGVNSYSFGQGAYTQKQFELLTTKLSLQAEQVNMANASYQANLAKFGQNASETKQAYSAYLEAQLQMADMAETMNTLKIQNQQNFTNYAKMLGEVYDTLSASGFTDEEIRNSVSNQTGWVNMNSVTGGVADMMDHFTQQATDVQTLVNEAITSSTQQAVQSASTTAQQGGAQAMQSYASGIQNEAPSATETVKGAVSQVVTSATEASKGDFSGSITNLFEGAVDGASGALDTLKNFMTDGANGAISSFNKAAGIESPSTVMMESGVYLIEGLMDGIDGMIPGLIGMSENAATSTLTVFTDSISQYPMIGQQMMQGLADGIAAGASTAIDAAVKVATAALAAAQAALGIHSPSREFYRIGEMIDQGLANGIEDSFSIVDGSISKLVNRVQQKSKDDLVLRPVVEYKEPEEENLPPWTTLVWDSSGNLVPSIDDFNRYSTNKVRITVDKESYRALQNAFDMHYKAQPGYEEPSAGMKAAYDRVYQTAKDIAEKGLTQSGVWDLTKDEGPAVLGGASITINNNSPKALNSAEIERNTNTGLAKFESEIKNASK